MHVVDSKTDQELVRSILAETAKASNELRCARADVEKAQSRLQFTVALLNEMIKRQEIK
jgi:hypothetical protein